MTKKHHHQPVGANDSDDEPNPDKAPGFWNPTSHRFRLTMLLCGAVMANAFARNTLSMAMVCMVDTAYLDEARGVGNGSNSSSSDVDCPALVEETSSYDGTLKWNSNIQGLLFSAMFWGGLLVGLPVGFFADRYNPKNIVTFCLIINLIGCVLTPVTATEGGATPVFVLRFIMGIGGQAAVLPCIAAITTRWVPPAERSTVIAVYTAGAQLASVISTPLNAELCRNKSFFNGWPAIFYVAGMIVAPIILLWMYAASNSPEDNKNVSETEKEYIKRSLQEQYISPKRVPFKEVPWKAMLTSPAVIVGIICNFALSMMNATLTSYVPTYFKQSLRLSLESNGWLSALPFLSQWLGKLVFATLADRLKSKTSISHNWICKTFNTIGTMGTAAFLMACAYMTCETRMLAVVFMTIASGLFSCQVAGFLTSLVSIAPNFSGMVNAMSRFFGQCGAVVAPYVVGEITVTGSSEEWRIVFWVISGCMVLSGVLFLVFGSADIQPWAQSKQSSPKDSASFEKLNEAKINVEANLKLKEDVRHALRKASANSTLSEHVSWNL